MTTRPSLVRSFPFWGLVAGSVVTAAAGTWLVVDKVAAIESALINGTETGVEIYAGQPLVVLGAVLIGAGVIGALIALAIAAAASLRPAAVIEVVDPIDPAEQSIDDEPAETVETELVETADPESPTR